MTLACEYGNSKLIQVVTVADVDDKKRVDDSLVQIWKLKFGHKVKYVFRFWVQSLARSSKFRQYFEAEVCSVFCCWCFLRLWSLILVESQTVGLVKILNFGFRRDFEAEVWSVFCCWCLIEVNLGQYSEARFGQDFGVGFQARFWSWSLVSILKLMLNRNSEVVIWSRFVNCELVTWTETPGPWCLWQCFKYD